MEKEKARAAVCRYLIFKLCVMNYFDIIKCLKMSERNWELNTDEMDKK